MAEGKRQTALGAALQQLGLQLPSPPEESPSHPLPQLLVASPSQPDIVSRVLKSLSVDVHGQFKDVNDTFHFHDASEDLSVLQHARKANNSDDIRHVIVYADGTLPAEGVTPLFNVKQFYDDLFAARNKSETSLANGTWGLGDALFYGETVTSTQTLLDKYVQVR